MLIDNNVEIVFNPSNKFHFIDLGYSYKNGGKAFVPTAHLTKGSNAIVNIECDICGNTFNIKYKEYLKRMNNSDLITCEKCRGHNVKITKKKIYGDENYCNKNKIKKTKLEKYGDENYCNINKIKETKLQNYGNENYCNKDKIKETFINKYGVENIFQLEEIKKLSKNKKLEKYGDENYNNKEKFEETCLRKYGSNHQMKNKDIKEKLIKRCMDKYGSINVFQNNNIKMKSRNTCVEKYGYEYYSQTDDFWNKFKKSIRWKEYDGIKYQTTYELTFLIFCKENDIKIEKYVPRFKYELDGKKHYYIPDFYIEDENLIIEIKSSYWLKVWENKNIEKKNSVLNNGYNYMMILDNDFKDFKELFNVFSP